MKNFLAVILLSAAALAYGQDGPKISFETLTIDYGTIEKGADGKRSFEFTNSGNAPLIISAAKGSCGCTVPSYPKEPILEGQSNAIEVRYDTNRIGPFTKYVTLTTNSVDNSTVRLTIKGVVQAKPVAEEGGAE